MRSSRLFFSNIRHWLGAIPTTAADNPLPYLSLAHVEATAINWDDLLEGRG